MHAAFHYISYSTLKSIWCVFPTFSTTDSNTHSKNTQSGTLFWSLLEIKAAIRPYSSHPTNPSIHKSLSFQCVKKPRELRNPSVSATGGRNHYEWAMRHSYACTWRPRAKPHKAVEQQLVYINRRRI